MVSLPQKTVLQSAGGDGTAEPSSPSGTPHDLRDSFRAAMAGVCAPVSVVTTMAPEGPYGSTVSAFASLSMDPPMVLVALDHRSGLLAQIRRTRTFGLNVLADDQSALAMAFANRPRAHKFDEVAWDGDTGSPRLHGVGGFLSCDVDAFVDGGDHIVLLGLVRTAQTRAAAPLTYHNRAFGTHTELRSRPPGRVDAA